MCTQDRRWAIVSKEAAAGAEARWHVENIYEMKPELARIKPVIEDTARGGQVMKLQAHGFEDLVIPIRTVAGQKPHIFIHPPIGARPSFLRHVV